MCNYFTVRFGTITMTEKFLRMKIESGVSQRSMKKRVERWWSRWWLSLCSTIKPERKKCVCTKIKSKTLALYGQVSEKWEEETSQFDLSHLKYDDRFSISTFKMLTW